MDLVVAHHSVFRRSVGAHSTPMIPCRMLLKIDATLIHHQLDRQTAG